MNASRLKIDRKLIRRASVLTAALAGMAVATWLLGGALLKAAERETEYKFLSEALDSAEAGSSIVEWDADAHPQGRDFTASDGAIAGLALTEAWHNLLKASRSGNTDFLEDHFDGPALIAAKEMAARRVEGIDSGLAVLSQHAIPRTFHADGSVLEILSDDVLTVRYEIDGKADRLNLLDIRRECSRQILFLQTVGWKIRNHELDCARAIDPYASSGRRRALALPLKGVNYYTADHPWQEFWPSFDEEAIDADFATIATFGAGTIRIFVTYDYFSKPETAADALKRLDHLLYLAGRHGISVIPTLFDFRNSYDPGDWAGEYRYLKSVAEVLKAHDNVQLVDLKNEADLDYAFHGKARVKAWLILMAGLMRDLAPELSLTVGWLDSRAAIEMAGLVDVVSYHEYGDPADSAATYEATRIAAAGKPVVISEIGKPSWTVLAGAPFSQGSQADWLAAQFQALSSAEGVIVWTLHDFDFDATAKIASLPWRRAMQAHYGLIDRDGQPKQAADIFRNFHPGSGR